MRKEECYFLGVITRRHGLLGNVILKLDTDQPELYNNLESVFVEVNGLLVPFFIQKRSWSKFDALNVYFKNSTEQLVDQLIGKSVYLPLASLPKLSGNKFYYHEVVGFEIIDQNGTSFGLVKSVNDVTAQPYFRLKYDEREVVVPLIKDWIVRVERGNKTIEMNLPDGLLDVFLIDSKKDE